MAKIVSVNISEKKGTIKYPQIEGKLVSNFGLYGDAHAGNWHRQVSLLGMESIDKMINMGIHDLVPGVFAENITTEGIILYDLPVGTRIQVGEVLLEITQIGKECHSDCSIMQKIGRCIMPIEGVFAKVIVGGTIKKGDEIQICKQSE